MELSARVFASFILSIATTLGKPQSITEKPLVLQDHDMDLVVKQSMIYKSINDTSLRMDIYYPPEFNNNTRLPVVIFNNGVGSMTLPDWRGYTDWARLVALQDLIAVHYQSRRSKAMEDTEDLIRYLLESGDSLGIDSSHMGIWTSSANVRVGFPVAMDHDRIYIRCLVIYYGSGDMDTLRQNLPTLIVRAGLDSYRLNRNINQLVEKALSQDIQIQLINYLQGQHGFDILDDTDRSREIIRNTLDFLKFNLTESISGDSSFFFTATKFYDMVVKGHVDQAKMLYWKMHQYYQNDPKFNRYMNRSVAESSLNSIGYQLLDENKADLAIKVFELMMETFPESPNAFDSMADGYEATGRTALAIEYSELVLEKLKQSDIREDLKKAIRENTRDRLKRLQNN